MPVPSEIFQLKLRLLGISPMVWRRVLVSSSTTLRELHGILQAAMAQGARSCLFGLLMEHYLNPQALEFCRYMTTFSAGILNPRPSETRSVLIGYFGLLGLIATIR